MEEDNIKTNYCIRDKYGKMWIETKDFFSNNKVREMINKLKNSDLVKSIDKK